MDKQRTVTVTITSPYQTPNGYTRIYYRQKTVPEGATQKEIDAMAMEMINDGLYDLEHNIGWPLNRDKVETKTEVKEFDPLTDMHLLD